MNCKVTIKHSLYFLIILFVSACSGNDGQLTIPEDKLIKVFFDLYAADQAVKEAPKEQRDSLKEVYTKQVFQIHHVSQQQFKQNLNQLQKNPERFKKFYDKLDKYGDEMAKTKKDGIPMDKK